MSKNFIKQFVLLGTNGIRIAFLERASAMIWKKMKEKEARGRKEIVAYSILEVSTSTKGRGK